MFKNALAVLTVAALLTACGGGGGGGDSSDQAAAPTTPTTPTVTPADLQTSVPTPTYAPASQALNFVNALNAFRSAQGLGLLAQSTNLDTAAANHLNYLLTNNDLNFSTINSTYNRPEFHIERSERPGFTGVQESNRAQYAGYTGAYVGELGAYGFNGGGSAVGALNNLIDTVYHRAGLLIQGVRDIGVAVGSDTLQTIVVNVGYKTAPQTNASDYVGFYPANTQTGVPRFMALETPNPFPDVAPADYSTKTGYPIHVMGEQNATITVSSFTVTEEGQTTALDSRLLTAANDPNATLGKNVAFLVAKTAFKPNTKYNVSFSGAIGGFNVTRSWSFTTGS